MQPLLTSKKVEDQKSEPSKPIFNGTAKCPEKDHVKHVYHLYFIKVTQRDLLQRFLESASIQCGIHYPKALPFLNAYKKLNHDSNDFPVSHKYQSQILSLPIYPEISTTQIEYVCNAIISFFSEKIYLT